MSSPQDAPRPQDAITFSIVIDRDFTTEVRRVSAAVREAIDKASPEKKRSRLSSFVSDAASKLGEAASSAVDDDRLRSRRDTATAQIDRLGGRYLVVQGRSDAAG